LRFTSFGLGDSSYPKFNYAHRKLYNRIAQLGGRSIYERGEADEQHPEGIDGSFLTWSSSLRQSLLEQYPLPLGIEPVPDSILLEPKWLLVSAKASCEEGVAHAINKTDLKHGPWHMNGGDCHDEPSDSPTGTKLPIMGSIPALLQSNTRITPEDHWQDVRHLVFSTAVDASYAPGDVLTIYPKNFPSDVQQFIDALRWTDVADKPVRFAPTRSINSEYPPAPLSKYITNSTFTIRSLLTNYYDIMAIPRRSFFAHLAYFTTDEFQKDRLLEFTNPEYIDELYDYTTRPRRSILEVMQEFETVEVPWQRLASILPIMRGRQFSIASGGRLKHDQNGEGIIELLVAIVKYKTVIKRIRQGVCTRFIASLKPGQCLNVTLQKGGLKVSRSEAHLPVVMIGPGTGVAPMRSMIYERLAWSEEAKATVTEIVDGISEADNKDSNLLFYGCRNVNADFFFKEDWQALSEKGMLAVHAAFSRDQREKIYVQDLVRRESRKVYDTLVRRVGLVYICGSSGKMPQAVREALIEVFHKEGALDREAAEAYLVAMEKSGRYKQETW